jgi:hypothetical protein
LTCVAPSVDDGPPASSESDNNDSDVPASVPVKRILKDNGKTLPPTKKARTSSIRAALEDVGPPQGLLRYFRKATERECQEQNARETFDIQARQDDIEQDSKQLERIKKRKHRERATERKRASRARRKNWEIEAGIRNPNGTLHKVNTHSVII